MQIASQTITRGDKYSFTFNLTKAGFDFTGAVFVAQVRAEGDPDGTKLADITITANTGTVGTATCVASVEGSVTAEWPAKVIAEISVEKSGASFGPYTIIRRHLTVTPDYAHA